MTTYAHLTGKERAQQEFFGVTLTEHPGRPDFVDDSTLVSISDDLDAAGVPVPEFASDTAKGDQESAFGA